MRGRAVEARRRRSGCGVSAMTAGGTGGWAARSRGENGSALADAARRLRAATVTLPKRIKDTTELAERRNRRACAWPSRPRAIEDSKTAAHGLERSARWRFRGERGGRSGIVAAVLDALRLAVGAGVCSRRAQHAWQACSDSDGPPRDRAPHRTDCGLAAVFGLGRRSTAEQPGGRVRIGPSTRDGTEGSAKPRLSRGNRRRTFGGAARTPATGFEGWLGRWGGQPVWSARADRRRGLGPDDSGGDTAGAVRERQRGVAMEAG